MSRMRSVVSQFASPMRSSVADESQVYHSGRPGRRETGRPQSAESAGPAVGLDEGQQPGRQLDLEADPVGIVRARKDAAALVAVGERGAVPVRNAKPDALPPRAQRAFDAVEERLHSLARAGRERYALEPVHERADRRIPIQTIHLVERHDGRAGAELELG